MSETSLVPEANQVARPESFTHELTRSTPFWYDTPSGAKPDGRLPAGGKLAVTSSSEDYARVVDERGFAVTIAASALKKI